MKLDLRSAEEVAGFLARLGIYTPEQIERHIVQDHGVREAQAKEIVEGAVAEANRQELLNQAIVEADQEGLRAEHNV